MNSTTLSPDEPPKTPKRRGYGGKSAEDLAEERRERLMASALELFGTQGYAATPTEKLCAHAKVTTRHFYEHFRDREALLIALFERVMTETRDCVLSALSASLSPDGRFVTALEAFLEAQLSDPRRARLTTIEVLGVSPEVEACRNTVIHGFASLVEQQAHAMAEGGLLPKRNYRVLAFGIVGAMHELQIAWLNPANDISREELKNEILFIVQAFFSGARTYAAGK